MTTSIFHYLSNILARVKEPRKKERKRPRERLRSGNDQKKKLAYAHAPD